MVFGMAFIRTALLLAISSLQVTQAQTVAANNITLPTAQYWSRPQNYAPLLNITTSGDFSPGYIFLTPYQHPGAGPYIYDKFGNLVWDGFGVVGAANAHDFRVCQYQGTDHLCMAQVNQAHGYGVGQGLILDGNYSIVKSVQLGSNFMPADMHEFNVVQNPDKKDVALMTSYMAIPFDLSSVNITSGQGWLLDCGFQEIDIDTGAVNFEWFAHNHVDPSETLIKPNSTDVGGTGFSAWTAFDFFHLNSIAKTAAGNYLVSSRHTSTLYHINGTDRTIIWRLSCENPKSDIKCADGLIFSFQHDARILNESSTSMTLSIFDNADNCFTQSSPQSSGRIIHVDLAAKTATQLARTTFQNISSCSQGNTQLLSNGNTFHGWGDKAWFSEHDPDGNVLLGGTYTGTNDETSSAMSYRIFSFEWDTIPANTKPQVFAYSQNGTSSSSTNIYVSWNGATGIDAWNFYAADMIGEVFEMIGESARKGFETTFVAQGYHPWVMVEGVSGGKGVRNSSFTPTFVPGSTLSGACGVSGCAVASEYANGATT